MKKTQGTSGARKLSWSAESKSRHAQFRTKVMAHNRFLARTVLVGEGSVNQALRALQRVLTDDKIIKDVQLKRNYEKPTVKRRRLKYESSLKLYNSEVKKKVEFLMSKQRKVSPWT